MSLTDVKNIKPVARYAEAIKVSRIFSSTPEKAFNGWTRPEYLEQWFGPPGFKAKILMHDLREGGQWRFLMESEQGEKFHHFGTFISIKPNQSLVFTWASEEQVDGWRDINGDPTLVTVTFDACDAGVKVTVIHENLMSKDARLALSSGWSGSLFIFGGYLALRTNNHE
ncbi:MAG: SRPBCC domain-containing protein [Sneathiella sp.]|nr:SRPBCC domain-containing protein [Sneathiella sp.]